MIQFNYLRIYLDSDTVSGSLLPRIAMIDMIDSNDRHGLKLDY